MAAVQVPGTPTSAPNGAVTTTPEASEGGNESELMAEALAMLDGEKGPEETEKPAEKPVEKPAEKPPDEVELSKAFAALTAKERRFNERKEKQNADLLAREAKLKKDLEDFTASKEKAEWQGWRDRAKQSPLTALVEAGWTKEQIIKYIASDGEIPVERFQDEFKVQLDERTKELRAEQAKLKEELENDRTEQQRLRNIREAQSYEARVVTEIDDMLSTEAERYRFASRVPKNELYPRVLNRMITHYRETGAKNEDGRGEVLAVSDAMLYIEKEAERIASWFQTQQAASQGGTVESGKPGAAKPETEEARPISQRESSARGVKKTNPDDMTDDERAEEALRILTGDE